MTTTNRFCGLLACTVSLYIQLFQLRLLSGPEQSGKVEYERERLAAGNR
jgi:hypothetical protein